MGSVDIFVAGIGTGGTITGTGRYLNMIKETIKVWANKIIVFLSKFFVKNIKRLVEMKLCIE